MTDFIQHVAKAISGLLTPFVLLVINLLISFIGIDTAVNSEKIETWIYATVLAVITSIVVYFTKNRDKTEPQEPKFVKADGQGVTRSGS